MDNYIELVIKKIRYLPEVWKLNLGLNDQYTGHYLDDVILSFVTYKRICDICERSDNEYLVLDYRKEWSWNYVRESSDIIDALVEAINCINSANFRNIPYGDKLIPNFYVASGDKQYINPIIKEWMNLLDDVCFDLEHINEKEWLMISCMLRNKTNN